MDKDKLLNYIDKAIANLEDEQDYNEYSYKKGKNPHWVPEENATCTDVMDNWWGYEALILQLEQIKKRIINEDFNYSWTKREKGEN